MHSEGFEPSPIKNTTWTYRLRPLGQECLCHIAKYYTLLILQFGHNYNKTKDEDIIMTQLLAEVPIEKKHTPH